MQKVMLNEGSLPMAVVLLQTFSIGREVCITTGSQDKRLEVRGKIVGVKDGSLVIYPSFCGDQATWPTRDCEEGISVPITEISRLESGGQVIEFKVGGG